MDKNVEVKLVATDVDEKIDVRAGRHVKSPSFRQAENKQINRLHLVQRRNSLSSSASLS